MGSIPIYPTSFNVTIENTPNYIYIDIYRITFLTMGIIDEFMVSESMLTDEERAEVQRKVREYNALDMDLFIDRIGGRGKIDTMNRINEKLNNSELVNGKLVPKKKPVNEDLEEWKKGFMDGFEEAYKRLNALK